jgi:hypothetical protein
MNIAVIGTGNIGTTLGAALARSGHQVVFGSRHPDDEVVGAGDGTTVTEVATALEGADVVLVAIPGPAVEAFAAEHGPRLAGKLILDASNKMGGPVANCRAAYETHAPGARYARVFNCVGLEILQDPKFGDERADMFFAGRDDDQNIVEQLVSDVGLRPVFVGHDATIVDGVFRLWIALAIGQKRGRQLALHTMER